MFVTERSFEILRNLDAETKKNISKHVNELIDHNGTVLYGIVYDDGTMENFSTKKDENDTHVLIGIGAAPMGILEPIEKNVKQTRLSEKDKLSAEERRIKDLEGELHQLRHLQKETEKPNPTGGHPYGRS